MKKKTDDKHTCPYCGRSDNFGPIEIGMLIGVAGILLFIIFESGVI